MYGKLVFPGLVKPNSKGTKCEGKANEYSFVVSPSNVSIVAKKIKKIDKNWVVQASAMSDLIVKVGGSNFHLHKLPMVSRSQYLSRMLFQRRNNEGSDSNTKLQIDNIPGGAETFKLVVKFCYGWKIDLTPSNIAPLYCSAHFLGMSDDFVQGNLVSKTEAFLSFLIFSSWRDTFQILKSCEAISYWAKELRVLQRCSESIALKASINLEKEEEGGNKSERWWFEDVSCMRIDHFIDVIQCMKIKGIMEPSLVGSCIARWTNKWLSETTFELNDMPSNTKTMMHRLQRVTTESLIRVLPYEESSMITSNFLLRLLKVGLMMQANVSLLESLEERIVGSLELCRVSDLLVECYRSDESFYDVGLITRVARTYVSRISSNLVIKPKLLSIGRLVDGYLMMVSKDKNLDAKTFQSLVNVLPKDARYCDDNLYRAVDMYLKEHPGLIEVERMDLCRFLEYHRLSKEARDHAMKNNRLPIAFSTKFLLCDQINSTSSKATFMPQFRETHAIVKANGKFIGKAWNISQKEIKKMMTEVETVQLQLNDLQKCRLVLLRKLKGCGV